MKLSLTVAYEDNAKTVKYLLKNRLLLSERLIKKLKFSGKILLNSTPVHVNFAVKSGDLLEAYIEIEEFNDNISPEPFDIDILYEDDTLIAVNKPPNMVVHPTYRHLTGTVANGLTHYLLKKGVKTLIRPVSRLDRDTTGIVLFALNPFIQENLIRQMHNNIFLKEYVGIVHGSFNETSGTIDLPIERLPGSIMLRHTSSEGSPSITHFKVLECFENAAFLKFTLETGRTHQIRVHCQAVGHPLIGDTLYSLPIFERKLENLMTRQALHSFHASFLHPLTNKLVEIDAPIPKDMKQALEILRK